VIRHGVTLQGVDDPNAFAELAASLEASGYDNLWITDSSLHAGDCYVYATVALQATSRLVVGTAVTNPLTRHPAITANVFRTLAQLAPGRVICGIGVGDRPLQELGLPMAKLETLRLTVEGLRSLWRGETVDATTGRHRFSRAHLLSPVDEIPVYVAASGPRALEEAGVWADGAIVLAGVFEEGLAFAQERLAAGRARSQRASFETILMLYGAIDDDDQAALDAARSIAAWFPQTAPAYAQLAGMSAELMDSIVNVYRGGEFQQAAEAASVVPDELVRKLAFAGTPAAAAEKLRWLNTTGIDAVSLFPLGGNRRATIEAFSEIALAPV
jgi:5,10-methylenetetrahydromethanopterin reductase